MTMKKELNAIIGLLPENASWNDLINELYKQQKIDIGMTEAEKNKDCLSNEDIYAIRNRLSSSINIPDDMRNTKNYNPGNATTVGMVAGVIAILFSFVFPPISWLAGIVSIVGGGLGIKNKEPKAWIPILMALISLIPVIIIWI